MISERDEGGLIRQPDDPIGANGEAGGGLVWHDGSMPYSSRFDDHYYSRNDGRAECRHVFLAGNNLPDRWRDRTRFAIGELGFGTGLNLLETWRLWREVRLSDQSLDFVSFERYPLPAAAIRHALSAWPDLSPLAERLLASWPAAPDMAGTIDIALDEATHLTVFVGDASSRIGDIGTTIDAWYLDGFAPSKNPDLWSETLMRLVVGKTAPGGTFATYSAAGWVRRNLTAAGFSVEKRRGHAGKRDMMRGVLPG